MGSPIRTLLQYFRRLRRKFIPSRRLRGSLLRARLRQLLRQGLFRREEGRREEEDSGP